VGVHWLLAGVVSLRDITAAVLAKLGQSECRDRGHHWRPFLPTFGGGLPSLCYIGRHGSAWAKKNKPVLLRATYRRSQGIRYFHRCYSLADDQLWASPGHVRPPSEDR